MVNVLHHAFGRLEKLELYRPTTTAVDLKAANTNKRTAAVFLLQKHFNKPEMESLCFGLAIDYEELRGDTFKRKVEELVDYCDRRGRFRELIALARERRPNEPWTAVMELDTGALHEQSTGN